MKPVAKPEYFFDKVKCDVGLVIDRGFNKLGKVLVIMENDNEQYLSEFTAGLDAQSKVDMMCLLPPSVRIHGEPGNETQYKGLPGAMLDYNAYDLIITSLECYKDQRQLQAGWIDCKASVLLISQYQKR